MPTIVAQLIGTPLQNMNDYDMYEYLWNEGRIPRDALRPRRGDTFDFRLTEPDPEGLLVPGNIDLYNRPVIRNPDGSISTIESSSFSFGDKNAPADRLQHLLLPTISPTGQRMSPNDAALRYRLTGQHLGQFTSHELADAYAKELSRMQGRRYYDTMMDEFNRRNRPWIKFTNPIPGTSVPVRDPGFVDRLTQG